MNEQITTPDPAEIMKKQTSNLYTLLPILELGGWGGHSTGWLPYFDWRKSNDLVVALIVFASERNESRRNAIKAEIIERFYGGVERYQMMMLSIGRSGSDLFKK